MASFGKSRVQQCGSSFIWKRVGQPPDTGLQQNCYGSSGNGAIASKQKYIQASHKQCLHSLLHSPQGSGRPVDFQRGQPIAPYSVHLPITRNIIKAHLACHHSYSKSWDASHGTKVWGLAKVWYKTQWNAAKRKRHLSRNKRSEPET